MKFSALQQKEYGVDLPQDQQHSHSNDTVMANMNDIGLKNNNNFEEGSVISNLPLLFANGYPTSLEKITLPQLERFVTFMIQCSLSYENFDTVIEPQWWPKEVKFSNPLVRPRKATDNWMANLKKIVFRCYTYHRSEYLLRFCSYLARYSHEDLQYINNWDSTTSLYHKNTGKLLVTFRNENMNYDKIESPRKKLLTSNGATFPSSNKTKPQQQHSSVIVEPPTEDIFLCDNCDAEFVGLEEIKEHERVCYGKGCSVRPATPILLGGSTELKQDRFLEYFRLCSVNEKPKSVETCNGSAATDNDIKRISRRVRGSITFTRCPTIPFSSPAGIFLAKKSKVMTEETQQERLERTERYLIAPVLNSSCKPKWLEPEIANDKWLITYKPNREKSGNEYVHEYKFVNSIARKPMLSIRSQLLYVICRPVHVLLTRLSQKEINDIKDCPMKWQQLIRNSLVNNTALIKKSEEKIRQNGSFKRKAPSDESMLNGVLKNEETISSRSTGEILNHFDVRESSNESNLFVRNSVENTVMCRKPSSMIPLIDLCSSDEEQDQYIPGYSKEYRESMNLITRGITTSLLPKFSSSEFHLIPRIHTADETDKWLPDTILNSNGENYTRGNATVRC